MAAVGCHVARIGPKPVSAAGAVMDKRSATIGQMLQTTQEMRILEDLVNAPSSVGYPTIEDYVVAEAVLGYKVAVINQSWVITYNG